jgi:hypothetical protein
MKIVCKWFKPFERNTLRGFAEINITELGMTMRDVAIHTKNGSTWAQPPAKPQIKDGAVVIENGKAQYINIIEFGSREARDKFSNAVISAVQATDEGRRALGAPVMAQQARPHDKPAFDDEIPF